VTNREKLIEEITALSDRQLAELMLSGYAGLNPERPDFGMILCEDCQARIGRVYQYDCGTEDCPESEADWMRWPCRRERILEVRT
jgi:hypothetical protein